MQIDIVEVIIMQQVRSDREPSHEAGTYEGGISPTVARTEITSLLNDSTSSQRHCMYLQLNFFLDRRFFMKYSDTDRLESLEREMACLKGQVSQAFLTTSNEHELNRSLTSKKTTVSQLTSARLINPSRFPLQANTRKISNEETQAVSTHDGPFSRPLPQVPVARSKSVHNGALHSPTSSSTNTSDEANLLRSYKLHIEQVLRKDAPPFSDIKVPNYASIEDVLKANEVSISNSFLIVIFVYSLLSSNCYLKMIVSDPN